MKYKCLKAIINFTLIWISGLLISPLKAEITLPRLISEGMILQQNAPLKIWGRADAGETVRLDFLNQSYNTTANEKGEWSVNLPKLSAGGPYSMVIRGENTIEINNILIGEVWICSGQSNMELPVYRVAVAYPGLMENTYNPHIRHFGVATAFRFKDEAQDFKTGAWSETTPENIPYFSAVGYFFADALYQKYKVPVGLIRIAVGGSPAEAWLSEEAVKNYPEDYATLQLYKNDAIVDSIRKNDARIVNAWNQNLDKQDAGLTSTPPWYETPEFKSWKKMEVPGMWENNPFQEDSGENSKKTNGVIWLKKEIDLKQLEEAGPALLVLGALVDRDEVYINGEKTGTTGYRYPPRRYPVREGILQPGKNIITIRLVSNSGVGGFVPDKFYGLITGRDTLDLSGEWYYKIGYASEPLPGGQTTFHYQPSGLFNALVAPLKNYKIRGAIWYQGESNVGNAVKYRTLMQDLIYTWREKLNAPNLPFLYVQLANFLESREQPGESAWAEIREAQLKTLEVPNTGMAVTIDIGEWNDIHPLHKKPVGERLARAAQKIAYQDQKVVYSGPVFKKMKVKKNWLLLRFSHTGKGLEVHGDEGLKEIAIAGENGVFQWAQAEAKKKKIRIWNNEISRPVAVRYAWADNPDRANLYNKEGLPASPFRAGETK